MSNKNIPGEGEGTILEGTDATLMRQYARKHLAPKLEAERKRLTTLGYEGQGLEDLLEIFFSLMYDHHKKSTQASEGVNIYLTALNGGLSQQESFSAALSGQLPSILVAAADISPDASVTVTGNNFDATPHTDEGSTLVAADHNFGAHLIPQADITVQTRARVATAMAMVLTDPVKVSVADAPSLAQVNVPAKPLEIREVGARSIATQVPGAIERYKVACKKDLDALGFAKFSHEGVEVYGQLLGRMDPLPALEKAKIFCRQRVLGLDLDQALAVCMGKRDPLPEPGEAIESSLRDAKGWTRGQIAAVVFGIVVGITTAGLVAYEVAKNHSTAPQGEDNNGQTR